MSFEEELLKEMNTYKPLPANWFIFKEVIDKYCLDKQKVKEVIMEEIGDAQLREDIYTRLGL